MGETHCGVISTDCDVTVVGKGEVGVVTHDGPVVAGEVSVLSDADASLESVA